MMRCSYLPLRYFDAALLVYGVCLINVLWQLMIEQITERREVCLLACGAGCCEGDYGLFLYRFVEVSDLLGIFAGKRRCVCDWPM